PSSRSDWQPLARKLSQQRLQSLTKYLVARDGLPAVRRLIVLPSTGLAGIPLEVCTDEYTISYALSGTLYPPAQQQGRPAGQGLFALADPVFAPIQEKAKPPALPPGGLLVVQALPEGAGADARLKMDDVLLRYADTELRDHAQLQQLLTDHA